MGIKHRLSTGAGLIQIERAVTDDKPAGGRSYAGAAQPLLLLLPDQRPLQMRFAQPVESPRIEIVFAHENLRGLHYRCIDVTLIACHLPLQVERKLIGPSPGQEVQLVPDTQQEGVGRSHRLAIALGNYFGVDQTTEGRATISDS